jgi:adenosylmethionine-8-amino-7-oxononanoate aminotransferase
MSVCDPVNGMHSLFSKVLPQQYFAPAPHQGEHPENEDDIKQFSQLLEKHQDSIAAVILEPIVQNTGGMRIYRAGYLKAVETLCKQHNVLLILDEIATGFGRTGTLFALEQADVIPDILCIGKTLTGGYLTLGATLTTQKVAAGISASKSGALMHGPTYMGNPLACAVANASIDLLLSQPWKNTISNIEKQLIQELEPCRELSNVKDVRVKGSIGIVELHQPIVDNDIQNQFVDAGIWIRPFSNLVYVMPPYIITSEQLNKITQAICSVLVGRAETKHSTQ